MSNFGILIKFFQFFFDQIRDFESSFGLVSCFYTRFWLLFIYGQLSSPGWCSELEFNQKIRYIGKFKLILALNLDF